MVMASEFVCAIVRVDAAPLPIPLRRADVMGMPAAHDFWTAEMVRALPDDGMRYEAVHGELLVTPAPRHWHQEVVARLLVILRAYLRSEPVGNCVSGPADISWSPDSLVSPDILVVDMAQARTLDWANMRDLKLVVEVLSPGTTRHDRFTKRRLYQENGVAVYWIVDADAKTIEIWRPEQQFPEVETVAVTWHPEGASSPAVVALEELFAPL
jgi:Uma2 family endonuclease